jgi:hypothetical protein
MGWCRRGGALASTLLLAAVLAGAMPARAFELSPANVQRLAIYAASSTRPRILEPNAIVFDVTQPATIASLLSAIDFATPRDCSDLGALEDAILYVQFNDGSIEVYQLLGAYEHIAKVGFSRGCYAIDETGRALFRSLAR